MDKQGKVKPRVDQMWMCVIVRDQRVDMTHSDTLRWNRSASIKAMMYTKSGRPAYTWPQLRRFGWRCVKVNLSFEI